MKMDAACDAADGARIPFEGAADVYIRARVNTLAAECAAACCVRPRRSRPDCQAGSQLQGRALQLAQHQSSLQQQLRNQRAARARAVEPPGRPPGRARPLPAPFAFSLQLQLPPTMLRTTVSGAWCACRRSSMHVPLPAPPAILAHRAAPPSQAPAPWALPRRRHGPRRRAHAAAGAPWCARPARWRCWARAAASASPCRCC